MAGYIVFIVVGIALIYLGKVTRTKGFENLNIKRIIEKNLVRVGEEFKVVTVIENNKWFPISFLTLKEFVTKNIKYTNSHKSSRNGNDFVYENNYSIGSHERVRRTYKAVANKRGTYIISHMECIIGDMFGFSYNNKEFRDYKEILVYPKEIDINKIKFDCKGIQGDTIVKRWIYEDPIFIKGVRNYSPESRMKDIHWKASSKLGKFMVKEYDHTSDIQFNIILNVQCGKVHWQNINEELIEKCIEVTAAVAKSVLGEGIPVGIGTNAMLVSFNGYCKSDIKPSLNSLEKILQFCARVGYDIQTSLYNYLKQNVQSFSTNSTYILVTPYIDEDSENLLFKLGKAGYSIKIIDVSMNKALKNIRGIEKIVYEGVIQ
ncbi:DUF58 domain-containing protein [Clostridium neuense]|uniref:DUF58 domain-containing protein n=1 Tax=Clostridium neuense TaxID=1728934 RepID=A0ABW8T982_9CLOT